MKVDRVKIVKVVSWVLSISFLILGFIFLFSYIATGIMLLIGGLILLPPLYSRLKQLIIAKTGYVVPWWQRSIAVALFFILAISFTPRMTSNNQAVNNPKNTVELTSSHAKASSVPSSTISSSSVSSKVSVASSTPPAAEAQVNGDLTVDFIDVWQGDSELIRQGNRALLIDAGPGASESKFVSFLSSQGISEINYLVVTHPHEDHIGNADLVLQKYKVDNLLMPKVTTNTKAFENMLNAANSAKAKGLKVSNPSLGSTFNIGSAKCEVLGPVNTSSEDLNTYSIVIKITYGKTKFLFTGDSQESNEAAMLAKGYDLSADVLKVGHHGSKTSTSQAFLNAVHPKYAVIEVGAGNDYGHPTQVVLDRLSGIGAQTFRTDLNGTIVCTSDGTTIKFDKSASPVKQQAPPPSTSSAITSKTTTTTVSTPSTDNSRIVYWTPGGKSYHYDRNCSTLKRSKTIESGTLSEAMAAGKTDPCDKCVK